MANTYEIISELLRSNSEIIAFQKNKINELASKDFPFQSDDLIDVLKSINKETHNIFENLKQTFEDYKTKYSGDEFKVGANPYEELLIELFDHIQLIWIINALIHFMEQSSHENVSQSTVFLIDRLTEHLEEESRFLLTPIFENNFTYRNIGTNINDLIYDAFPNAKEILEKFPKNFSILSFPAIHRDNIVSNILLAHEVGHFINDLYHLESKVYEKIQIDHQKFNEYLNTSVLGKKEEINQQDTDSIIADNWEYLSKSLQNWIKELLSDAIGFRLTGPVFVFMLSETLLSISTHGEMTERYPPPSMRIKIILEEIKTQGFSDAIGGDQKKNLDELFQKIEDYLKTPSPPEKNFLLQLVYDSVFAVKDEIIKIAAEKTKSVVYNPETFGKDVPNLMEKLNEIIPPCEIGKEKPADVISILNAGIIYKMTWMKENKYNIQTSEEREKLEKTINSLVLKAIELSVLEKMMLQHKPKEG